MLLWTNICVWFLYVCVILSSPHASWFSLYLLFYFYRIFIPYVFGQKYVSANSGDPGLTMRRLTRVYNVWCTICRHMNRVSNELKFQDKCGKPFRCPNLRINIQRWAGLSFLWPLNTRKPDITRSCHKVAKVLRRTKFREGQITQESTRRQKLSLNSDTLSHSAKYVCEVS